MKSRILILLTVLFSCAALAGCGSGGSEAPSGTSGSNVHPSWWNADPYTNHRTFFSTSDPAQRLSWTNCANTACHGPALQGGTIGPSCFSATGSSARACHDTGPPAPQTHITGYDSPALHGLDARDSTGSGLSMGNYCLLCHGRPSNNFDGGFVSDANILNNPNGNCSAATCHPNAKAHPTDWTRTSNPTRYHGQLASGSISATTISQSCALCHNTTANAAGPFTGAPSCFVNNFNGLTCHSNGPGSTPHTVPFLPAAGNSLTYDDHGAAAKADLVYCQGCHGEVGGAGSNPRFNLTTAGMPNGCEGCHPAAGAHPTGSDRWTFNIDTTQPRRTHFAAGNVAAACALCHDLASGTDAKPCSTCHTSTSTFALNCTACHGSPPDGTTPDLTSATLVDHLIGTLGTADLSAIPLHEDCSVCHGASDDTTGKLQVKTSDYLLFNASISTLDQGGDHLDGLIEMNGPTGVGAGYNQGAWSCDQACHSNTSPYVMEDSALTVAFGNYGAGACDTCHGYPPTTDGGSNDKHAPGAIPVDHSGTNVTSEHSECNVCHGFSLANGRTDNTGSGGDEYLSSYHQDGNIEMNGISLPDNNQNADYQTADAGCARACHANDGTHQLTSSGLTVQLHEYSSGDCNGCHETGVGGAPIVKVTSPHVDADGAGGTYTAGTCTDCHSGHTSGVQIPNLNAVGINYTAGGIYLGGTGTAIPTAITTEAEICWDCHDSNGVSEWNGTAYQGYTVSSSDWTAAIFNAPGTVIPNRPTAAIHMVDSSDIQADDSSVASNINGSGQINITSLEPVNRIRCSYCHDVHDTYGGAATDGAPYLRGTWLPNPYDLERPPEVTDTFTNNNWGQRNGSNQIVNIPRLLATSAGSRSPGGFVIDQNNSTPFPTNGETVASSAGLCTLCHGADVDAMGDDLYPGSSLWIGGNGHSNSTLGGTGSAAVNLFDARRNMSNGIDAGMNTQLASGGSWGRNNRPSARPRDLLPSSDRFNSVQNNPTRITGWYGSTKGTNYTAWYSAGGIGTNGGSSGRAHDFSCSKCHSPHATGLPALLITNCLDYQAPGNHAQGWTATMRRNSGNADIVVGPKATDTYAVELGAGLCHRNDSQNTGWIKLAPNQ